jgi:hypothetical protein
MEFNKATVIDPEPKRSSTIITSTAKSGMTFGSCLAMVVSYTYNQSIFWAILHGFLGWFYVIFYMIFR